MAKFGLELHAEKTRLIEFGQHAERSRKRRGEGKPETFTFLGFTHYCGKRRSDGSFIVWRKTAKKRMVAKLRALKAELISTSPQRKSQSSQSARRGELAATDTAAGTLDSFPSGSASLPSSSFCRHTSKVGAVCVNAPVRICAGGRSEMAVPTATLRRDYPV